MYKVEIKNTKDYLFSVKSKNYEFNVDIKGNGITPPDTLLASLGSCIGVYIRKYADVAKLNLEGFQIVVEAELSQEQPICFRKIKVSIDLNEVQLDERRKKALLSFIENCPVHHSLHANPEISISIV